MRCSGCLSRLDLHVGPSDLRQNIVRSQKRAHAARIGDAHVGIDDGVVLDVFSRLLVGEANSGPVLPWVRARPAAICLVYVVDQVSDDVHVLAAAGHVIDIALVSGGSDPIFARIDLVQYDPQPLRSILEPDTRAARRIRRSMVVHDVLRKHDVSALLAPQPRLLVLVRQVSAGEYVV